MTRNIGLGFAAVAGAVLLLSASPSPDVSAQTLNSGMCGERANPVDKKTEHRIQAQGICVTGGDNHSDWWLAKCIPENHTSSDC